MKEILGGLLAIVVTVFFIWGTYWIVKTVSYNLFYESMVKQTVVEMVKKEALK